MKNFKLKKKCFMCIMLTCVNIMVGKVWYLCEVHWA